MDLWRYLIENLINRWAVGRLTAAVDTAHGTIDIEQDVAAGLVPIAMLMHWPISTGKVTLRVCWPMPTAFHTNPPPDRTP